MSDPKQYPYEEGDTIVLGPEIFASADRSVICWKGENYIVQPAPVDQLRVAESVARLVNAHDDPGELTGVDLLDHMAMHGCEFVSGDGAQLAYVEAVKRPGA